MNRWRIHGSTTTNAIGAASPLPDPGKWKGAVVGRLVFGDVRKSGPFCFEMLFDFLRCLEMLCFPSKVV